VQTIWMKQGSLWPKLQATINIQRSGNLTGCSVAFRMRDQAAATWVAKSCTIVSEELGTVEYQWQSGDTDVPGTYWIEFWVTVPNVGTMVVPDDGNCNLSIMEHIGS